MAPDTDQPALAGGARLAAAAVPFLAVLAVLASGCDGGRPRSDPTTPAAPSAARTAIVRQSDWLTASVEVGQPDGLAAVAGSVFVKSDTGLVTRVDPVGARVVDSAEVDTYNDAGHYCTGIAADATSLWTCSAGRQGTDLVRLDPDTLRETARFAVDKLFDQLDIPVVDGRVWVLSGIGDRLTVVDAAGGAPTTTPTSTPLGRRCFQLAATATRVYATCLLTDEVIAVDASTLDVVATATVNEPRNISVSGEQVWVSGVDGLIRMSADLDQEATYPDLYAGAEGDLLATSDAVWLRQETGFLLRLDPATGGVTRFAIDPVPSGGSVLVVGGTVWVSCYNDDVVYRVDPGP